MSQQVSTDKARSVLEHVMREWDYSTPPSSTIISMIDRIRELMDKLPPELVHHSYPLRVAMSRYQLALTRGESTERHYIEASATLIKALAAIVCEGQDYYMTEDLASLITDDTLMTGAAFAVGSSLLQMKALMTVLSAVDWFSAADAADSPSPTPAKKARKPRATKSTNTETH